MRISYPIFSLLVFILTACSSQTAIVHDLSEREANEILTYLNEHNIPAIKEQAVATAGGGGKGEIKWEIQVASDKANEAMSLLNAVGLPRIRAENLLDIFSNGGLVPSDLQEQIRYQAGLAQQISNTIRKFDGVIDATVTLAFPKEDPLNPGVQKNPVQASVYVKHNGVLDDPNSHLESKIRRYVANAVPGLTFDNVTVVGERARYSETGFETSGGAPSASEKPLVSVWTLIIAKESITRFRVIFFSFLVAIIILLAITAWLIWKILPLLKQPGGIKQLLSPHHLTIGEAHPTEKKDEKKQSEQGGKVSEEEEEEEPPQAKK